MVWQLLRRIGRILGQREQRGWCAPLSQILSYNRYHYYEYG